MLNPYEKSIKELEAQIRKELEDQIKELEAQIKKLGR